MFRNFLLPALGAITIASVAGPSIAIAQNDTSSATTREIWSFPSYSAQMTPQSCAALYDEIGDALRQRRRTEGPPVQSVSDGAIQWALAYENAQSNGRRCPRVPAPPPGFTQAQSTDTTGGLLPAPTVPNIEGLGFSVTDIPQAEYEAFMSCTAKHDGALALGEGFRSLLQSEARASLENQLRIGRDIQTALRELAANLPVMAAHLDRAGGERAYGDTKYIFDEAATLPPPDRYTFWRENSDFSASCQTLAQRFSGLQSIYRNAAQSIGN